MTNETRYRRALLGTALAGAVVASVWPYDDAEVVEAVVPLAAIGEQAMDPGHEEGERLKSASLERNWKPVSGIDPFRAKGWFVPPPAPPPMLPAKPTAPPLPFVYIGRAEGADGSEPMVYLVSGGDFYPVKAGEEFARNYRLDAIENDLLVITYLPLATKQHLFIGMEE